MAMTERPWLRQTDNDPYGSHDISRRGNGAYVCSLRPANPDARVILELKGHALSVLDLYPQIDCWIRQIS